MMSERLSTSRPREKMMTLRGSLGSERLGPEPRPRDSFHLRRDSSFWSVGGGGGAWLVGWEGMGCGEVR